MKKILFGFGLAVFWGSFGLTSVSALVPGCTPGVGPYPAGQSDCCEPEFHNPPPGSQGPGCFGNTNGACWSCSGVGPISGYCGYWNSREAALPFCPVGPTTPVNPTATPTPIRGLTQGMWRSELPASGVTIPRNSFGYDLNVTVSGGPTVSYNSTPAPGSYSSSLWNVVPGSTKTVTLTNPPTGWSVGSTLCYNDTSCHGGAIVPGNSVVLNDTRLQSENYGAGDPPNRYADLWWHFCPLAVPGTVSVAPVACGATSAVATWGNASSRDKYALRIDDTIDPWRGDSNGDGSCDAVKVGDDYCVDNIVGTSYTFTVKQGRSYNIWVHAQNVCGGWSSPSRGSYNQATCPITWNMTLKPVCAVGGPTVTNWETRSYLREWQTSPEVITNTLGSYGTGTRSVTVTSDSLRDLEYLGLQDRAGVTHEPKRITPADSDVSFGRYFTDNLYFAKWDRNLLPAGSYTIEYQAPVAYCPGPTITPTRVPPTPTNVPPHSSCRNMEVWRGSEDLTGRLNLIRVGDQITYRGYVSSNQSVASIVFSVTTPSRDYTSTAPVVCGSTSVRDLYRADNVVVNDQYGRYKVDVVGVNYGPCVQPTGTLSR